MLTLGMNSGIVAALVVVFLLVCLVMILTVLIQRPQGGGLSGAFGAGGAGSGQTAFGTKTGDALTIFTIATFVAFVCMAIWLNFLTRPQTAPGNAQPAAMSTSEGAGAGDAATTDDAGATTDGATTDGAASEDAPQPGADQSEAAEPEALPETTPAEEGAQDDSSGATDQAGESDQP